MKRLGCDHVHLAPQAIVKLETKPGKIQKRPPGLKLNQEIDVAVGRLLPSNK